jgi:hypothetical protein
MEPAPEPQLIQGFKELLVADASNVRCVSNIMCSKALSLSL